MVFDPSWLTAGSQVLSGIGGLLSKKKTMDPRASIHSTAQGAREASEKYGFNPLTLLNSGAGGFGGGGGGGTPMLASAEILTNGLRDVNDILSGDADRRRAADTLNLDMAKLKYEIARSGFAEKQVSAADSVGGGSVLGRKATTVAPSYGTKVEHDPKRTSTMVAGIPVKPHLGWSDAQSVEDRYGDVASWIYGIGTLGADAYNNMDVAAAAVTSAVDEFETTPLKDRSQLWMVREWGAVPDGFNDKTGKPFWLSPDGNGFSNVPPNKR